MISHVEWPRGLASELELNPHGGYVKLRSAYICESQFLYLSNGGNNHTNLIEFS